jgi:outer membrane receptor protein involved in Fe transport
MFKNLPAQIVLIAPVVTAFWPQATRAQTATDPNESIGISEIVVTAQKREQQAFQVPISITAVSADDIARRGATAIEDLQYSVPGLSIAEWSPGEQRIQLRGTSVYSGLPTVGVYLDELPLNTEINGAGMDVRMLDIDRVEVLRGPQGTLYGQGAMGGTIRYIVADPKLNIFEGQVGGETAAIDHGGVGWTTDGAVNLPVITDTLAVRLAGSYQNFGGWVDNTTLGIKDANHGSSETMRAKALLQLTDGFKITLLYQHQLLRQDSLNLSDSNNDIAGAVTTPISSRADLVNLVATYDFGVATLLSSSGYIDRTDETQQDLTPYFVPLFEAPAPYGLGFPVGSIRSIAEPAESDNHIFNQEVRLTSNGNGPWAWTLGGMFRNSTTFTHISAVVTPDVLPFELADETGTNPSNSRSWAVFGDATYHIVPRLEATLGLRYFEDDRSQNSTSTVFGVGSTDVGSATFHALTPRYNLLWHATDTLNLYTTVSEGFRSGGFNMLSAGEGVVTVPATYAPDQLWSYELGGKFQSADRRVSAELAVYHNDWKNVQSLAFAPGGLVTFTTNDGKLAGNGVDAQLEVRPIWELTLGLTGGYSDMRYKTTTVEHISGDPADYVPPHTASVFSEYRFDWAASLPGFARVDYQVTDGFQVFVRNAQTVPAKSDTQRYLNLRLGLDTQPWLASVFAKNILNEDGVTYPAFGVMTVPTRPEPRSIGVSVSRSF